VPKLWIEPVHGVIPGQGFRIDWLGLWAEIAEGVSVQNIQVRLSSTTGISDTIPVVM
jgi:hypothetical protein